MAVIYLEVLVIYLLVIYLKGTLGLPAYALVFKRPHCIVGAHAKQYLSRSSSYDALGRLGLNDFDSPETLSLLELGGSVA